MAYEELPFPDFHFPIDPRWSDQESANFILLTAALNFAFTDFASGKIFAVREGAKQLYDSDAMFFCLAKAIAEGIPLLQSDYLSRLTPTLDCPKCSPATCRCRCWMNEQPSCASSARS